MASIEYLILILVGSALLSYLLSRISHVISSVFTILVTMFVFVSIAMYGFDMGLDTAVNIIPGVSFAQTYLGFYFVIIIAFVYLMVSFFHPYFVGKYKYKNTYNMFFMLSLAGIIGAFYTDNFLQLFFFFEIIIWTSMFIIPMGRKIETTVKYFGFSVVGSVSMLLGVFIMKQATGVFDISAGLAALNGSTAIYVYLSFLVAAFAKLGAFPLHTWLPDTYQDAPDTFTAVLSGGLSKLGMFVGIFALVRIAPVTGVFEAMSLPIGHYIVAILGSLSIVFGTLMAIKQDDAKRLLAYSSMSHGGYILVAFSLMDSIAFAGGFYHILAHAIASTGAFLAIAAVERATGTTEMKKLGGMIHKMPITYLAYLVAIISIAGIPPMGGFISKWLIFQTVINKGMVFVGIAVFFGSIGSFLYVFRPLAALFLGQEFTEYKKVKEAPLLMLIPTFIIMLLNVYTGVFPGGILKFINNILVELGSGTLTITGLEITGHNGILNPAVISLIFGVGVALAFVIFIVLKKSKKVDLMNTYTAANFVHDEHLLHYSTDFYAPLERIYEKHTNWMKKFYRALAQKVRDLGNFAKYLFMSKNLSRTLIFIIVIIILVLWGEVL